MSLTVKDLFVTYSKKVVAINNISFDFESGVLGLLGQNGAGKTTLIKTILGLIKPDDGKVILSNSNKKGSVGYMPQELGLHPNLTVYETLDYYGILSNLDKNTRKNRIHTLLEQTNLKEQMTKKIKQLSGGMKRRVSLAQALITDPALLVVDEPTVGLDPDERIRMRNLISSYAKNRLVIFSTHIVEDLASTCNQLLIMERGNIIFNGTVQGLLQSAAGNVFVKKVSNEVELENLGGKCKVVGSMYTQNGILARYVSNEAIENSNSAEPNIEDAYIYTVLKNKLKNNTVKHVSKKTTYINTNEC